MVDQYEYYRCEYHSILLKIGLPCRYDVIGEKFFYLSFDDIEALKKETNLPQFSLKVGLNFIVRRIYKLCIATIADMCAEHYPKHQSIGKRDSPASISKACWFRLSRHHVFFVFFFSHRIVDMGIVMY